MPLALAFGLLFVLGAWLRYFATGTPVIGPLLCKISFHHPVKAVIDEERHVYRCRWCFGEMHGIHTSQGVIYKMVDK